MEKRPHKSTWKTRKKSEDDYEKKEEVRIMDVEFRQKLNKIKTYVMITAVVLVVPVIIYFFYPPIMLFVPFINLIAVFIAVFMIYFPISDVLKKPKQ
ncbi:MAG: hypothetical protein HWN66_10790 [Candidatus Helarchaeota archaeon]|nr:hypothetical protein [Candidatus Helarchaeota archaeon]